MGKSFNILRNNTLPRANLRDDCYGILDIHYGDVLIRYGAVINVSELQGPSIHIDDNCFLGDRLADGDIVMADTAEDTTAGKCVEIQSLMNHEVVAGLHTFPLRPIVPKSCGYWGQYLNSLRFRNQLFPLMQGTKVVSLSRAAVSSVAVCYPSQPEQRLIGRFFSTLDSLIAAAERQEVLLRQKKQAYLQLMVPQEGENEPRLRFAGFSGEWERRQLGEVAEVSTGGRNTQDGIDNGKYPFFIRSQQISSIDQFDYDETASLVPGDGRIGEIFHLYSGKYALHQRVYRVVPNQSRIVPNYLLALMQFRFRRHVLKLNAQGTVPSLRLPFFTDWEMPLPSSPEQRRIGSFFSTLDNLIAAAKKHTASLRALKFAYLQRMFV